MRVWQDGAPPRIRAINTGAVTAEAVTSCRDDDGRVLPLPFTFPQDSQQSEPTLGAVLERTLQPNFLVVMDTLQPNNPTEQAGSALLQSGGTLNGFAIFQYAAGGRQAVVPLETRNAPSYLLAFDYTSGLATGLALANLSAQARVRSNSPATATLRSCWTMRPWASPRLPVSAARSSSGRRPAAASAQSAFAPP